MKILLQCKLLLLTGLISGSINLTNAQSAISNPPTLRLKEGLVSGTTSKDGIVNIFKCIPYAAPPTGPQRWKAPQPVRPWKGTRDCTAFPASAIQNKPAPFLMWSEEFISPPAPLSEDCLYLNVWTSAKAGKKMPVFVWIHGGGFVSGSGACAVYDGESMARDGIVFITINYRLGVFGFLSLPGQEAEKGNESGNFALLDQIAALKWIRQNVAAFGGDPEKITIGGQSAGSMCVNALVASPLANGLFRGAIAQSGVLINNNFTRNQVAARKLGSQLLSALEAKSLEEARAIPADRILDAANKLPFRSFTPYVDGYLLPSAPGNIIEKGAHNKVPLLIGWVNRDGDLLQPGKLSADSFKQSVNSRYPAHSNEFLQLFPANNDAEAISSQQKLGLLQFAAIQSIQWANWNRAPAYVYHFEFVPADKPGFPNYGAFHTSEVPYALHNLSKWDRPWRESDLKVEKTMSDYWKNFIRTGNPNGSGIPEWTKFQASDGKVMIINEFPYLQPGYFRQEIQLLKKVQH